MKINRCTLYFRNRMKTNINYGGIEKFTHLLQIHKSSFAYVTRKAVITFFEIVSKDLRDIDVLQESLGIFFIEFIASVFSFSLLPYQTCNLLVFITGTFKTANFLKSDEYIPERMVNKIDETTSSMMENGLYNFYKSFYTFMLELRQSKILKQNGHNDEKGLTMDQMMFPFILYLVCLSICLIVFLIEIIVFKLKNRKRNCYIATNHHIEVVRSRC